MINRFMLLLTLAISCEHIGTRESISPIVASDLPLTCLVGETISFNVHHVVFNGCGKYSRQETVNEGNVITIKFYARYPEGRACSDNIPTLETNYSYKLTEKGEYYFKFYQDYYNGQEFLLDTLRVQ